MFYFFQIHRPKFDFQNVQASYNPFALNVFQQKYNYFNWIDFLTTQLPFGTTIKHDETIVVLTPDFFTDLGLLLNRSNRRTIINYLIWRVINDSIPFLSNREQLESSLGRGKRHTRPPKWRDCVDITKKR